MTGRRCKRNLDLIRVLPKETKTNPSKLILKPVTLQPTLDPEILAPNNSTEILDQNSLSAEKNHTLAPTPPPSVTLYRLKHLTFKIKMTKTQKDHDDHRNT